MNRYKAEVIDKIPEASWEGKRKSVARSVLKDLSNSPTGIIVLTAPTQDELERIYKTMIQWRTRHKDMGIGIKKQAECVYVWQSESEDTEVADRESSEATEQQQAAGTVLF